MTLQPVNFQPMFAATLWLITGGSLVWSAAAGGAPERFAAFVLCCGIVLDLVNHALFGSPEWFSVDPGHLVLDLWALLMLEWLAMRANRGWPIVLAGCQLLVMCGHLAKLGDPDMARRAYWVMTQVPLYVQLPALVLGTLAHRRRMVRWGRYPDWINVGTRHLRRGSKQDRDRVATVEGG